jgi:hypothetical protein
MIDANPEIKALAREARAWFAIECDRVGIRARKGTVLCCRTASRAWTGDRKLSGWRRVRIRPGSPPEARVLLDRLGGGNDIRAWLGVLAIRNLARTKPEVAHLDARKWHPAIRWIRDYESSMVRRYSVAAIKEHDAIRWAMSDAYLVLYKLREERKKRPVGDSTAP